MSAPFAVKLDEDLPESLATLLAQHGYTTHSVRGQGWSGTKDPDLWPLVQREGVFFVTADKGFADIRHYSPGTHAGLLLLRPDRESVLDFRLLLDSVLRSHSLQDFAGCVVVATPRGVRIRRP